MTETLFERYKASLRSAHVAALEGRLEAAVSAFEAAAALAPDRALPCVGLGDVLCRLARHDAAAAAYGEALRRSADDESALRGRATIHALQHRPIDAAEDLARLAEILERAGRLPEACEAACDALDLAESRSRRKAVERLARRLAAAADDEAVRHAVARARAHLEVLAPPEVAVDRGPAGRGVDAIVAGSAAPAQPTDDPARDGRRRFDRIGARLEAEDHIAAGRHADALPLLLAVASAEREAGELDAALDACLILLAIDPADPAAQLELAANQVARGWTRLAGDKVRLLERLSTFSPDAASATAIAAFAKAHGLEAARPG